MELRLVSSMTKVFLDEATREDLPRDPLTCLQNGTVSFQAAWRDAGGVRPQAGTRLGLSLRLTDADSGAAHGAAAWGRGLESWTPSSFGSLVLLP